MFFYSLLANRKYCKPSNHIKDIRHVILSVIANHATTRKEKEQQQTKKASLCVKGKYSYLGSGVQGVAICCRDSTSLRRGPRAQIMGFSGPNTIILPVFGGTLSFGSLGPYTFVVPSYGPYNLLVPLHVPETPHFETHKP